MLKELQDFFDFISLYPVWIKITVPGLLFAALLLLILLKPTGQPNTKKETSVTDVPVGDELVLDVSKGQDAWNGLTAWALNFDYPIRQVSQPFETASFRDYAPGVLVLALPKDKRLSDPEVASIKSWVERGGGLLVLGYYAADTHHGSNPSRLLREWGISFEEDLLMPDGSTEQDTRAHVFSVDRRFAVEVPVPGLNHPMLGAVKNLVVLSSASLTTRHASVPIELSIMAPDIAQVWRPEGPLKPDGMRPLIEQWVRTQTSESAPVFAAFAAGRGRVAAMGSWKIATLDYGDNRRFTANVINWLRPRR